MVGAGLLGSRGAALAQSKATSTIAAADTVLPRDAAEGVAKVQISQLGLGARVNTLATRSMGSAVDAKPATGLTITARPSAAPTVLVGVPVAAPGAMD